MSPLNLRKVAISLALFAFVALGSATVAMADSATLTVPNSPSALGSGPYATVNYVLNGTGGINVTVTGIGGYTMFGNSGDMFGFNVQGLTTGLAITNCVNCTGGGLSGQQMDGFGNFEVTVGGGTPPGVSTFSFTVTRTAGFTNANQIFETNSGGWAFVAHVFNPNGPTGAQTGFAANGTPTSLPEPASMFLLGTGLLGFAAGVRKRFKR